MNRRLKGAIAIGVVAAVLALAYAYFAPKSSEIRDDALPADAATLTNLGSGAWAGADDFHFANGRVTLFDGPGGAFLRFENYTAREGPDVYFYLVRSANATTTEEVEGASVRVSTARLEGTFNVPLPEGLLLSSFEAVVAWCDSFNVRFGTAVLTGPDSG